VQGKLTGRVRVSQRLAGLGIVILAMLGVLAVGAPARADGGCANTGAIGSCISRSGNWIYSDFYMNRPPDSSMCYAYLGIEKDGRIVYEKLYTLTRTGRYGPISHNVATLPPSHGRARTRVQVFTCRWVHHFTAYSPYVSY
jgi:hypothetical protein